MQSLFLVVEAVVVGQPWKVILALARSIVTNFRVHLFLSWWLVFTIHYETMSTECDHLVHLCIGFVGLLDDPVHSIGNKGFPVHQSRMFRNDPAKEDRPSQGGGLAM